MRPAHSSIVFRARLEHKGILGAGAMARRIVATLVRERGEVTGVADGVRGWRVSGAGRQWGNGPVFCAMREHGRCVAACGDETRLS